MVEVSVADEIAGIAEDGNLGMHHGVLSAHSLHRDITDVEDVAGTCHGQRQVQVTEARPRIRDPLPGALSGLSRATATARASRWSECLWVIRVPARSRRPANPSDHSPGSIRDLSRSPFHQHAGVPEVRDLHYPRPPILIRTLSSDAPAHRYSVRRSSSPQVKFATLAGVRSTPRRATPV